MGIPIKTWKLELESWFEVLGKIVEGKKRRHQLIQSVENGIDPYAFWGDTFWATTVRRGLKVYWGLLAKKETKGRCWGKVGLRKG